MKVKVKICGIRSLETAKAAIASGADFIGFNFVTTSKRYIKPEMSSPIIDKIRGSVRIVGVFQNAPSEEVNRIADMLELDFVQLHGEEDAEYMNAINRPVIKSITNNVRFANKDVKYYLVDRTIQGEGKMVDFERAYRMAKLNNIFFAGGLTPENVMSVVKEVKPFAVDVAGGIETDGKEDTKKIKQFIENAKGVQL